MENKNKIQKIISEKPQETKTRRNVKLALAFLGGSLLGGCGETIINNYYGMDAGPKMADSKPKSDQKPDTCKPFNSPLNCSYVNSSVRGVVNQGESFLIGGYWRLGVDDIDVTVCPPKAMLSLQNSCGEPVAKYAISEGDTNEIFPGVPVTPNTVALGYTFAARWVDLSIRSTCKGSDSGVTDAQVLADSGTQNYGCKNVSGQLNQGKALIFGAYKLQLDDLMNLQCAKKRYGLFSVLDINGNTGAKLKIEEGSFEIISRGGGSYKISVPLVGMGGSFGAKWANVEVYTMSSSCKD